MDRGAWWATVHGVAKSRTRLKRLGTHDLVLSFSVGGRSGTCLLPRPSGGPWVTLGGTCSNSLSPLLSSFVN